MSKILTLPITIILSLLTLNNSTELSTSGETDYEQNLNTASEYYLLKKEIPELILIKLVPRNYDEFELFYGTTGPNHRLGKTEFFYDTTQQIFEQVITKKNYDFYLPSLNLASFADGEYAEEFIDNLNIIIDMDKERFCNSVSEIKLKNRNPIKYYIDLHQCK